VIVQDGIAEKLAIKARASISTYCYTECRAYCCRKGYLLLTAKEVKLIRNVSIKELKMIPVLTALNKKGYVLDLGQKLSGCPNLENYKCTIHKNPNRPKTCGDFPLFIWKDKTIMVTNACPAVRENKLYPYLSKFKKMGYKLVHLENKI